MKKYFGYISSCTAIVAAFVSWCMSALPAYAQQGTFVPLTNTQNVGSTLSGMFTSNNLAGFFNALFTTALSIGAILAVLRLAYAGWLYMGSADMWGSKSKAREVIRDSVIGLLLLFGIYIILFQINPCLLNLDILQSFRGTPAACTQ